MSSNKIVRCKPHRSSSIRREVMKCRECAANKRLFSIMIRNSKCSIQYWSSFDFKHKAWEVWMKHCVCILNVPFHWLQTKFSFHLQINTLNVHWSNIYSARNWMVFEQKIRDRIKNMNIELIFHWPLMKADVECICLRSQLSTYRSS